MEDNNCETSSREIGLEITKKNYRPVSNLSFLSKVVEKCVLEQFNWHCTEFNLLPDFESAYRQNYNTETSLLKMVNDLLWGMERKTCNSSDNTGLVCCI